MKNRVTSHMRSSVAPAAIAALLALAIAPLARAADSLAARLPQDSIAAVEWAGADALKAQYTGSNLQGIVDATNFPDLLAKQINNAQIPGREGKGLTRQEQAIIGNMIKYPGAIAILPVDFTAFAKGGDLAPRAIFIMNAGTEAAGLAQQLTATLTDLKKQQPDMPTLTVKATDTFVTVTFGTLTPEEQSALDSGKASLAASETYTKAAANFRKDAALNVFIDGPKLLAAVEEGIAKDSDLSDLERAYAKSLIDPLGVRALTSITYSAGFDGKEWSEKTLVGMTKDHHGVLALIDLKPLAADLLKWIPKGAPSVNIVRLDLDRVFKEVRSALEKSSPDQLKEFDAGVQDVNRRLGFDIEKDFLAPMGDTWTVYRTGAAGDQTASFALIHPLRDAKTFTPSIEKLVALGGAFVKITDESIGDAKVWTVENPQLPISLVISGDTFIIASRLDLEDVISQLKGKTSILDRPEFIALQKALPQVQPLSLDFVDLKAIYAQSSAGIKQLVAQAAGQGVQIPPEAIPDPEKIAAFLTPGMSITWQDEAGFHLEGRSAFPGAGIVGLQQASLAPMVVLGAAALLPSTAGARQNARMTAEQSDERQLLMGVMMYSADTGNGNVPEDLTQVVTTLGSENPALRTFVSPRSSTKPLELSADQKAAAEKDWKTIQKDLDQHCDFVLSATRIKLSSIPNPSEFILIYPKPNVPNTSAMNIGFADGHVESVLPGALKSMVEQNNEARKTLKLPLLKIDDTGHIVSAQ